MKTLHLIVGVLLCVSIGRTQTTNGRLLRLEMRKVAVACKAGFGMMAVEQSDLEPLRYNDPQNRCLQSCVLTRLGLMQDMKMDMENLAMVFRQVHPEELAIKKLKAHVDCAEEEKNQVFTDECDFANKHMHCVWVKLGYGRN